MAELEIKGQSSEGRVCDEKKSLENYPAGCTIVAHNVVYVVATHTYPSPPLLHCAIHRNFTLAYKNRCTVMIIVKFSISNEDNLQSFSLLPNLVPIFVLARE